jgi:sugar transferase (PEP-CTERM/EpsH1 system associated)
MSNVLFLVHRIPYPPDKGDKIRSYHLLKYLCKEHRVFLGTFYDDANDRKHLGELEEICAEVCVRPVGGWRSRFGALEALIRSGPLSAGYYRDTHMSQWVSSVTSREEIHGVVAFSSTMAQYLPERGSEDPVSIVDLVDVDSDKWRQYAVEAKPPMSWLYRYEAAALKRYEADLVEGADFVSVVSEAEREIVPVWVPEQSSRVRVIPNGVDYEYFRKNAARPSPFKAGTRVALFTGAMDYRANVDGVCWFAEHVWPPVKEELPDAEFYIVGSNPAPAVTALQSVAGITVTGRVPDIRPYLEHATISVAPLRLARGVQNKVLEALSMELPVIATPEALRGLSGDLPDSAIAARNAGDFKQLICERLSRPNLRLNESGRRYVKTNYDWEVNLGEFGRMFGANQYSQPILAERAGGVAGQ